jgi:hypothetical protein
MELPPWPSGRGLFLSLMNNGDHIVIRWVFRFEWQDGSVTQMEELAHQRWQDEQIAQEQFFYDPAQRVPQQP